MDRRSFLTAGVGALGLATVTSAAFSDAAPPSAAGESIMVKDEEELVDVLKMPPLATRLSFLPAPTKT